MADQIRIAVVDDQPLWREGVIHTIKQSEKFHCAASGSSADDARRIAKELKPDIILLDLSMPGGGLAAARDISRDFPEVKIVILTVSEAEHHVLEALDHGVKGYLLKGVSGAELERTILAVHGGEGYVMPDLAARLLTPRVTEVSSRAKEADYVNMLTSREEQILTLVGSGKTNREIADEINLSEKTVKRYMSSVLQKLQVRNRVEAALVAQKMVN